MVVRSAAIPKAAERLDRFDVVDYPKRMEPPYEIDGKLYVTAKQLADAYGIPYDTLTYRLRNWKSVEEVVRTPLHKQKRRQKQVYEIDGKRFNSIAALARDYDIPYATLNARFRNGWEIERAVRKPVMDMKRVEWEVFGIIYPNLSAAAKAHDKGPEDIRQRVKAGMTIEDALTLPSQRDAPITIHDKWYPSVAAAAKEYGRH